MATILDHLAVGTPALSDGWELFGGILGSLYSFLQFFFAVPVAQKAIVADALRALRKYM